MAAPSYTEDLTDISLMESGETNAVALNISGGGGGAPAFGADLSMQGLGCWDKPCSNAERAIAVNIAAGSGTVAAGVHIFQWGFVGTPGITDNLATRGVYVLAGTGTGAIVQFHVDGSDTFGAGGRVGKCYPYRYVTTANTGSIPYRTVLGTPGATPTYFGYGLKTTATAKGSNIGMDAVRYGTGAYITAGEIANPATFDGFATQNDSINNRWGILTLVGNSYELQGRFVIGQDNSKVATLAYFDDSDVNIVLNDTVHSETDFTQLIIDHASTEVYWTNISITALGTNNPGRFVVNNASSTVEVTGGTWTDIGISTLRAGCTMTGLTWRGTDQITQNGATLEGCTIDSNSATAAVLSDDPGLLDNCAFISDGTGHAIEITTAGTYSLTGHSYSGYTGTGTDATIYNNSGGAVTLNVSGGDTPTIREGAGASTTVNATVPFSLTNVISGTTLYVEARSGGSLTAGDEMIAPVSVTVDPYTANLTANQPFKAVLANASGTPRYVPIIFDDTTGSGFSRRIEQVTDGT